MSVKIRVMGDAKNVKAIVAHFKRHYTVLDVSPPYQVRDRLEKGLIRQYVEVETAGKKRKKRELNKGIGSG